MKPAMTTTKITTKNQWLAELARMSKVIRDLNLPVGKDVAYVEYVEGKPIFDEPDAYNLSNSTPHNQIIVDAVDVLSRRAPENVLRTLLGELTFRNTYGAFSELVAYKWFGDAKVDFTPQLPCGHSAASTSMKLRHTRLSVPTFPVWRPFSGMISRLRRLPRIIGDNESRQAAQRLVDGAKPFSIGWRVIK
jgi:hypothetical protein